MEGFRAVNIAAVLTSVAAYGGQLAAVFHNYSLIAERIPGGFEGAINILDATVATLKQVLSLLKDEGDNGSKRLFSEEGLKYVHLLSVECAVALAKVEPIIEEACLERKERKALLKQKRKSKNKKLVTVVDPLSLKLDEKEFLEKIEKTKWSWATDDIEKCMERLYDLQLHILLFFQVVTVGALSRDVSSGKVDIKSIVTYHERIIRTADLVGIKPATGRSANWYPRRGSFSSTDSFSVSSRSDSDVSDTEIMGRENPRYGRGRAPPPPPPPPPAARSGASCYVPSLPPGVPHPGPPPPPVKVDDSVIIIESSHPPAYSESNRSGSTSSNSDSTLLRTMTPATSVTSKSSTPEKPATVYPDEKTGAKKEESVEPKKPVEPTVTAVAEPRLFTSKSTGLGFKFKSFFRSKESLAEEMKRTLKDTESQLTAFVIQRHITRVVPYSAFHSLEATHMKTILSQLNDDSWYKTFSTLDNIEHGNLDRLLHPLVNGKFHNRELVVLKVLQQNRLNAWMVLLSELLRNQPFPRGGTGRFLLAICREKLIDGKPIPTFPGAIAVGPPPPPPFPPRNNLRGPPLPYSPARSTKISDLNAPPSPPPPPNWPGGPPSPPPPSFGAKKSSIRISDTTPITNHEAAEALATYTSYSVRLSEPLSPHTLKSWSRVVVTTESAEQHLLAQRARQFEERSGNVIETKLRMTEQQSGQVTRIMDEVKSNERDARFESCWVEISLHNQSGEITNFANGGNVLQTATVMHLIAKRTLKAQYKALDVYNALMKAPQPLNRGPPPGLPPPGLPPPGLPPPMITPPKLPEVISIEKTKKSRYVDSDTDSDSSGWSSDSSVGHVRRRLRRYRARKTRVGNRKRYYGSDSEDESEEEEDAIKVNVTLKRGDDLVKKLLDLWTAEPEVVGNGKGKMV